MPVGLHPVGCICRPCLVAEVRRLNELINDPHTEDFLAAVRTKAAEQRQRHTAAQEWQPGRKRRTVKAWIYVIGQLAGQARASAGEERLGYIVQIAATALNWHRLATTQGDKPTTQD